MKRLKQEKKENTRSKYVMVLPHPHPFYSPFQHLLKKMKSGELAMGLILISKIKQ